MRVTTSASVVQITPGQPSTVTVDVFNSSDVISAYRIKVLGLDQQWVGMTPEDPLPLFPGTSGVAILTITLPKGIPAGVRRAEIQVNELTQPLRSELVRLDLSVPAELGLTISIDPVSSVGRKRATIGVLVENTGNDERNVVLAVVDEEDKLKADIGTPLIVLAPGERVSATAVLKGKRKLAGTPIVRPFVVQAQGSEPPVQAFGTFVQKPLISRGLLALAGLLLAVSVFATVITASLARVVDKSSADRDLVLQVVRGSEGGGTGGQGVVSGTVQLLALAKPLAEVTVAAFEAANTATPVASTATVADGTYSLVGLALGTYKIRFEGAGFTDLWYPAALTAADALPIDVGAAPVTGIDADLDGIPATITGKVLGDDPAGATVTLALPGGSTTGSTGSPTAAAEAGAVVASVTVDATGTFTLEKVPSPRIYDLVVAKPGFVPETQQVELGGGERREGISFALRKGDGLISGHVSSPDGLLGGVTITASDGHATSATVSLTTGDLGAFTLRDLPTPSTLTVLFSATGFASQTLTLTLDAAQQLDGVDVTLGVGSGSISGTVRLTKGVPPITSVAGGVSVSVSNGQVVLQTRSLSVAVPGACTAIDTTGCIGSYTVDGLPVPGNYTITFSRSDLADQTRSIDLDAFGNRTRSKVDATLLSATASVFGTVNEVVSSGGSDVRRGLGEIQITLASSTATFQVTSASVPTPGAYRIDAVAPGTYSLSFNRPGARPISQIITLRAGDEIQVDQTLGAASSITGRVLNLDGTSIVSGAEVRLFQADKYPATRLATIITGTDGLFVFPNVDGPQSYIVEIAYPQASPGQVTKTVVVGASGSIPGATTCALGDACAIGDVRVDTG